MIFSFCIMIGRHYVAYLQLMGGNLFLRKRNSKLSMMESFKMLMKDVEFVQEVQINSGASHDETFNELSTKSFNTEKCRNILDFITLIKMDFPQEVYIKRRLTAFGPYALNARTNISSYGPQAQLLRAYSSMDCHNKNQLMRARVL